MAFQIGPEGVTSSPPLSPEATTQGQNALDQILASFSNFYGGDVSAQREQLLRDFQPSSSQLNLP
jgi:hypothetical protein